MSDAGKCARAEAQQKGVEILHALKGWKPSITDAPGWPDTKRPGVPRNPERDGRHWMQTHPALSSPMYQSVWEWDARKQAWWNDEDGTYLSPLQVSRLLYLGEALLPSEVAALVVAGQETMRGAVVRVLHAMHEAMSGAASEFQSRESFDRWAEKISIINDIMAAVRDLPLPAPDTFAAERDAALRSLAIAAQDVVDARAERDNLTAERDAGLVRERIAGDWLEQTIKQRDKLAAENARLRADMLWFLKRVENGEVRSTRTVARFQETLAGDASNLYVVVPRKITKKMWEKINKIDDEAYAAGNHHGAGFEWLWEVALEEAEKELSK